MILKQGDSGSYVELLQKALNELGAGLVVDGDFGPATSAAVQSFQAHNNLSQDGVVGPLTQEALREAASHASPPVNNPGNPIVPPSGKQIKGIDCYHGDDVNDWNAIIRAGYYFAFLKASEGLGSDSKYAQYKSGALSAGFIVGAYHFFHVNIDPVAQAKHFVSAMGPLAKHELPPVLDWEYAHGDEKPSDAPKALAFLHEVQRLTGRLPIIYMSAGIPNGLGNPSWLADYPLWVANYGVSHPHLQAPYKNWNFWQFSESTSIPGLGNKGDANLYNGSLDDLKAFIAKT